MLASRIRVPRWLKTTVDIIAWITLVLCALAYVCILVWAPLNACDTDVPHGCGAYYDVVQTIIINASLISKTCCNCYVDNRCCPSSTTYPCWTYSVIFDIVNEDAPRTCYYTPRKQGTDLEQATQDLHTYFIGSRRGMLQDSEDVLLERCWHAVSDGKFWFVMTLTSWTLAILLVCGAFCASIVCWLIDTSEWAGNRRHLAREQEAAHYAAARNEDEESSIGASLASSGEPSKTTVHITAWVGVEIPATINEQDENETEDDAEDETVTGNDCVLHSVTPEM